MKVFLDECLPRKLKKEIAGHEVSTAADKGWSGKSNGELLALVENDFQVFVTADRNLAFQQNTQNSKIMIAILCGKTNRFVDLKPLIPALLNALAKSPIPTGIVRFP